MHGWGGHRGQLTPFVEPLLAAGFRVAAFDAPAHGDTAGQQASGYQMAAALRTVTEKVGKPAAVVAHSFGATALGIAMQDWLSLSKVVIIGATRRLEDTIKPFFKLNSLPESIEPDLRALTEQTWGGSNVWERTALDLALPKFDTPALVIHDRDDETTPYVSGAAVARAWRSAKMVTTRGLGHRGVLKDEGVIAQVVSFIAGHSA
jgi:pimeloyl-ACP methyl ester carboxylesterase